MKIQRGQLYFYRKTKSFLKVLGLIVKLNDKHRNWAKVRVFDEKGTKIDFYPIASLKENSDLIKSSLYK